MRNGQFCKLQFLEKPKLAQPAKKQSSGRRVSVVEKKGKTAVNSMISAEELFQGFGSFENIDKDDFILKPKGLKQILSPDYMKNMAVEKKRFHKMSAAIVSPNEIARIAKQEEERKMKLEIKMKHAVAIGSILPGSLSGNPKNRSSNVPDSPQSFPGRRRKAYTFLSFPSFELPAEKCIEETEEPDNEKNGKNSRLTPQMIDAAVKRRGKTGSKASSGSKRRISKRDSGRIRSSRDKAPGPPGTSKNGRQISGESDTESTGKISQRTSVTGAMEKLPARKEIPSTGGFVKNRGSRSVFELPKPRDLNATSKKQSIVSNPEPKTLDRAKSLPDLKPGSKGKRISTSKSPKRY